MCRVDPQLSNYAGDSLYKWEKVHDKDSKISDAWPDNPNNRDDWSGPGGMTREEVVQLAQSILAHPETYGDLIIADVRHERSLPIRSGRTRRRTQTWSQSPTRPIRSVIVVFQGTNGEADLDPAASSKVEQYYSQMIGMRGPLHGRPQE